MIICTVIGNVWATRKEDSLNGRKLMVVQRLTQTGQEARESFVAVDCVGAGTGERVLVVQGSSARWAVRNPEASVDAAIVGILDGVQSGAEE